MPLDAPRPASHVTPVTDVREYFRESLLAVIRHQRVEVQPETELYLVDLLADFSATDQLFAPGEGHVTPEPLALMLKQALESPAPERAARLRRMGDTALYVSGFFSDSLQRQLVDVDYYAAMGERAYDALGAMNRSRPLSRVFQEMASKFLRLVDLLAEMSERALCTSNAGLLRLYERYVRTGSERLRLLLEARGMIGAPAQLSWQ